MSKDKLRELASLSNKYGADPRYVLVGGGNSSYKTERALYIKASGASLATVDADGFVGLSRAKLGAIMEKPYDRADDAGREAAVLADMMDARLPDAAGLRPSVETLLHNLFSQSFVLHLHPALVNGMTCGARGEEIARELFRDAVWIPEYRPGYELAKLCEREIAAYAARSAGGSERARVGGGGGDGRDGRVPEIIFLQNHGVFVAADTTERIEAIYADIMDKLGAFAAGARGAQVVDFQAAAESAAGVSAAAEALIGRVFADMPRAARPAVILYAGGPDIDELLMSRESFAPLGEGAFTPDHIVYCRAEFLYVDGQDVDACARQLPELYSAYAKRCGYAPRVVCARGVGAFFTGDTPSEAGNARTLFLDAVSVAVYSRNFGGHRHLSRELTDFIINWEIEAYRQKVAKG